jgi:ATP-dependent DNA helicase RecG
MACSCTPCRPFSETAVREAVLNAVSHRDYRHPGSVFVRQYARHIEIVGPGGFPPGITPSNILDQQLPRNRRIAETFARCGLVERSGQGADRMLEECVRQSKPLPDYGRSDPNQVWLTLHGEIQNEDFLRFLERTGPETLAKLDPHDFLILGLLAREQRIPAGLQARLPQLLELGLLERIARGKAILARRLYQAAGRPTPGIQKQDRAREQNKDRLLEQIERHKADGVAMGDLLAAFPTLSRSVLKRLLDQLRAEGQVHSRGLKRQALWFPGRHV